MKVYLDKVTGTWGEVEDLTYVDLPEDKLDDFDQLGAWDKRDYIAVLRNLRQDPGLTDEEIEAGLLPCGNDDCQERDAFHSGECRTEENDEAFWPRLWCDTCRCYTIHRSEDDRCSACGEESA